MIVVFEGRDAAGKGGTIRAITERVSPRLFRLLALPVRLIAKRDKYTCSVTVSIFRLPEKLSSLTEVGTTARE